MINELIKKIKRGKSKLVYTCLSFAPYLLPLLSIGFSKDKIILANAIILIYLFIFSLLFF